MNNLIKFHEQLTELRNERNLSIESQRGDYIRNIMRELGRLADDTSKNNDNDGKINALCNILVFSLNCCNGDFKTTIDLFQPLNMHSTSQLERLILVAVTQLSKQDFKSEKPLIDLYSALYALANKYGYDLNIAMDEKIKELNRNSDISNNLYEWYNANYLKAKL